MPHLLDKEERETLEETLELSSDYVLEKMDTLSKFIIQFLQDFLHSKSRAEQSRIRKNFFHWPSPHLQDHSSKVGTHHQVKRRMLMDGTRMTKFMTVTTTLIQKM